MKITKNTIEKIQTLGISLDELAYLYSVVSGDNWSLMLPTASIERLIRQGYLKEFGAVSDDGIHVVATCVDVEDSVVEDTAMNRFDEFWELYPSTDKIGRFPASRQIKKDKARCKQLYYAASRIDSEEQIIQGLENAIKFLEDSYHSSPSRNPFTYMKSPSRFLEEREYMDFQDEKSVLDNGSNDLV